MISSKQTIKRAYDQYKPQDFSIGADNLNPKREMILDKMAEIEHKVQELTNEIVRKKIRAPQAIQEKVDAATGGESPLANNAVRKQKLDRVGGDLFGDIPKELETLIGAFPGSVNSLALPPIVDCEAILQKYDFSSSYEVYEETDDEDDDGSGTQNGAKTYRISTGESSDEDDDDSSDDEDDSSVVDTDSDDENDCAEIELQFLKIIQIMLKIIQVMLIMIDSIISVIITTIQVVCLAVGAWLNPPNIAQIVQIIMGIVMALVVKIISKLIQMIWDLLNLDCLADQTLDTLSQIQDCMNAFKTTLGMIDPSTITFMADLIENGMSDMTDVMKKLMKAKGEAWLEAKNEIVKTFDPDNLKKMAKNFETDAINAALRAGDEISSGKVRKIFENSKKVVLESSEISKEAKKKFDDTIEAAKEAYDMVVKGKDTKSSHTAIKSILKDVSIQGLKME